MSQNRNMLLKSDINTSLELFLQNGSFVEVRIIGGVMPGVYRPMLIHGYFNSFDLLFKELQRLTSWEGIYITLNPVLEALSARAYNRFKTGGTGSGTSDGDIVGRKWMLVDLDPIRPSGVSATDVEKAKAWEKIPSIRSFIAESIGIKEVVVADSGNGFHILVPVELPASDSGFTKDFLKVLGLRYDDKFVKVDQTVFNPARITKLYGTLVAGVNYFCA